MSEITRIMTVKITGIAKGVESDPIPKDEAAKELAKDLKHLLSCDDVVVTDVQDFVMEE